MGHPKFGGSFFLGQPPFPNQGLQRCRFFKQIQIPPLDILKDCKYRRLLRTGVHNHQEEAIRWIGERHLTVRQAEAYIEKLVAEKSSPRRVLLVKDIRIFINTINQAIDTMKNGFLAFQMDFSQN